uniref:HAP1 N-terminal domain-containing protein n=1 Tax=Rhabditophanes sp. KR3021 TaxID=114890 RepID=A0AC35U722_9BILA
MSHASELESAKIQAAELSAQLRELTVELSTQSKRFRDQLKTLECENTALHSKANDLSYWHSLSSNENVQLKEQVDNLSAELGSVKLNVSQLTAQNIELKTLGSEYEKKIKELLERCCQLTMKPAGHATGVDAYLQTEENTFDENQSDRINEIEITLHEFREKFYESQKENEETTANLNALKNQSQEIEAEKKALEFQLSLLTNDVNMISQSYDLQIKSKFDNKNVTENGFEDHNEIPFKLKNVNTLPSKNIICNDKVPTSEEEKSNVCSQVSENIITVDGNLKETDPTDNIPTSNQDFEFDNGVEPVYLSPELQEKVNKDNDIKCYIKRQQERLEHLELENDSMHELYQLLFCKMRSELIAEKKKNQSSMDESNDEKVDIFARVSPPPKALATKRHSISDESSLSSFVMIGPSDYSGKVTII